MQVCWLQWKQSLRNWNTVSPYGFVAQMVEVPDGQSKQELNVLYCIYCCISSVPRKQDADEGARAFGLNLWGICPESSPTLENCAKELLSLPTSFSFARGNRSILRKPQLITKMHVSEINRLQPRGPSRAAVLCFLGKGFRNWHTMNYDDDVVVSTMWQR